MEEKEQKPLGKQIKEFLSSRFNLDEDKAEEQEVVDNIKRGVDFRGTNLWVLIFAIVVASVGLNVNSTAVIIGAMLISPLMGPIMGIGLSLGINDFELMKRSAKNFLFAVVVSLVVSTLYFMVSPLTTAQSELLARASPTIWDVLIATFGGLAGIVAQSRKDRTSTVIPGVAIATALMPPLCAAGYGLATGDMSFFGGAFYLFFINAVFIAFATYFVVRFLKYTPKQHINPARAKQVKRYMVVIITATMVPSVILAYGIVQHTIFETNANKYIEKVFTFEKSEVINSTVTYDPRNAGNKIEIVMMGEAIDSDVIEMARAQMPQYNLRETQLVVRQANSTDAFDKNTMQNVLRANTQIIEEKNQQIELLQANVKRYMTDTLPVGSIARELSALWSDVKDLSISRAAVVEKDGTQTGHMLLCVIGIDQAADISSQEQQRISQWLAQRTNTKEVKIIIENR